MVMAKDDRGEPWACSKEDFCRFCHLLYDRHLVSGVGGNMAARAADTILLTPSGYSLRDVKSDMVAVLSNKGDVLQGMDPTKDADMHLNILRIRADVNVVCHVHGAFIIAASTLMEPGSNSLPPVTPGFVHYAYPLPMLPFMVPGTDKLARTVAKALSYKGSRAVLLQNHGLVTTGIDFEEALNIAEEIEEAARVVVLTEGKSRTIPAEEIDKIGLAAHGFNGSRFGKKR
jgi:ribulose-5-phosphate 4-epimerase/fuculose-1-phosphate aldolase